MHVGEKVPHAQIKQAQQKLDAGEILLAIFYGIPLRGESGERSGGLAQHYMLLTDKRIVFWRRGTGVFGIGGGADSTDSFPYEDVNSAERTQGIMSDCVTFKVRGTTERFDNISKADAKAAVNIIQERMSPEARARISSLHVGEHVLPEHIKQAQQKVDAGEVLLAIFNGTPLRGESGDRLGGLALHHYMLLTDKRIMFWGRGLTSDSTDAFLYEDVNSAEGKQGIMSGCLTLNVRGTKERFDNMPKDDTTTAANFIREKMGAARSRSHTPLVATDSPLEALKKLGELRDAGLVTPEEFAAKKAELLARI